MFRKLTHILLSVLLLLSTFGMAYTRHYCGEELVAIQWFNFESESDEDACCPEEDNDCCKDEFVQINPVQTEIVIQAVKQIVPDVSVELSQNFILVVNDLYLYNNQQALIVSDKPPMNRFDIGLVNCCFLI